jgi:tetratricopeptide (TPR) repeat protein
VRKLIPLLASALALAAAPALAGIPWVNDAPDFALRQASLNKQPILAYFHTSWCSWCIQLEERVFTDPGVVEKAALFVPLRIDADNPVGAKILERYQVVAFPTVLVLSQQGTVLGRLGTFKPAADFITFLDTCLTPGEGQAEIDARIEAGDRSPALLLKSAEKHYDAFDLDEAIRRFKSAAGADPDGKAGVLDDARLGLARASKSKGKSAEALEEYYEILRMKPASDRMAEAFAGALAILKEQDRKDDIDRLFDEFAVKFPDDPAVVNDQAKRALKDKDPALAVKRARHAVELAPKSADCLETLARSLLAAGKPSEALDAVGAAIELRPDIKDLRVLRLEILDAARKGPPPAAAKP